MLIIYTSMFFHILCSDSIFTNDKLERVISHVLPPKYRFTFPFGELPSPYVPPAHPVQPECNVPSA